MNINFKIAGIAFFCILAAPAFTETLPVLPKPDKPLEEMTQAERKDFLERRKAAFDALSPEQQEQVRKQRKERNAERHGGYIRNTRNQTGRIVFADCQDAIPLATSESTAEKLADLFRIEVTARKASANEIADPAAYLKANSANAVIFIVVNDTDPSLLIAPEDRWAKINVGKLGDADARSRTQKEILRAFIYLCGGITSQYQDQLCNYIGNPRQLDGITNPALSLDLMMRINGYLPSIGVNPYVKATYLNACKEGWAPAPTNDAQKAIWEKIKAEKSVKPSNPIKVNFDPKTAPKVGE